MRYPEDFQDPRHRFIGALVIDTDAGVLFIEYEGKRVSVGGADCWEWGSGEFALMLKAAGLIKRNGQSLIQIKGRTGKWVR